MLPLRSGILAKAINRNFEQMSPLIYTHIHICTDRYYQFYLMVLH